MINGFAIKFISSYLLLPLLGIFFGALLCVIAKKNKLLNNKKVIFLCLAKRNYIGLTRVTGLFRL